MGKVLSKCDIILYRGLSSLTCWAYTNCTYLIGCLRQPENRYFVFLEMNFQVKSIKEQVV